MVMLGHRRATGVHDETQEIRGHAAASPHVDDAINHSRMLSPPSAAPHVLAGYFEPFRVGWIKQASPSSWLDKPFAAASTNARSNRSRGTNADSSSK